MLSVSKIRAFDLKNTEWLPALVSMQDPYVQLEMEGEGVAGEEGWKYQTYSKDNAGSEALWTVRE